MSPLFGTSLRFAAIGFNPQGELLLIKNEDGKFSLPTIDLSGTDGLKLENEVFLPEILNKNFKNLGLKIDLRKIQPMQAYYPAPRSGFFTWGTIIKGIEVSSDTKHIYVSPGAMQTLIMKDRIIYGSPTHALGLRGFASRDNPTAIFQMTGSDMLQALQQASRPQRVIV